MFLQIFTYVAQNLLYFFLHFESGSFPKPLNAKEERETLELWASGSTEARDKLISHNLRLVAHIAKKYHNSSQELDDYVSIGTIGLIKAVNTFKIEKGRFSSYAARCIENELLMNLRSAKKTQNTVYLSDIIDSDKDGANLTREDSVADDVEISEIAEHNEEVEKLYRTISQKLEPRERQIIRLRYGLGGCKPMSQQQVCDILGISRSYVSRLEKKTIEKLRGEMR